MIDGSIRKSIWGACLCAILLLHATTTVSPFEITTRQRLRRSTSTRWPSHHWHTQAVSQTSETQLFAASGPRIVVVGGGVGGLAIASRMASKLPTSRVTILEKNEQVGGRTGSFDVSVDGLGTFRHERGPSLLLLPQVYKDLFDDTGMGTSEDYGLRMVRCTPAYQVVFDDGDRIDVGFSTSGSSMCEEERISRAKMDALETDGSAKWDQYMKICEAYLDCGLPNFIEEKLDLASFPAFLQAALGDFGKAWPLKPHSSVLDALFSSDKMKALASFQDLYVGLEPYANKQLLAEGVLDTTAPAVFGLLAAIELHPTNKKCGVFAPVGGFRSVAESMERLARNLNVEIKCQTTVTRVTSEGVYICNTNGDTSQTTFEPADFVVVNADLPYATETLLKQDTKEPKYDWDDSYRFSCGVIAFHWSLKRALDDLNTHNVFLSARSREDAEESWKVLRDGKAVDDELSQRTGPFNFYVHRASKADPTAAPEGMDSILVLVPCPTLRRDGTASSSSRDDSVARYQKQFDESYVDQVRNAVFERMAAVDSLKHIASQIVDEVVDTPATYADQYNLGAGTPFALSHGFAQLSNTRPGPFSSNLDNVCFCGASSRPGNGVPLVLVGAKLVADKVVAKIEKEET